MNVVYPQKKSSYLGTFLHEPSVWYVHSLFKNGVNLSNGTDLLFIGTDKNGELPFAVHLSQFQLQNLIPKLRLNQAFTFQQNEWFSEDQTIRISLDFAIDFCSTGTVQPFFSSKRFTELMGKATLLTAFNGFECPLPDTKELTGYNQTFIHAFKQLQTNEEKEIESGLRYFIGRGKGETPSGDDLLVGLLSVDTAYPILSTKVRRMLMKLIMNENLTTDISNAYLKVALSHQFSTSINGLLKELTKNKTTTSEMGHFLTALSKTGHTSGLDTLTGMILGLFIKEKQVSEEGK